MLIISRNWRSCSGLSLRLAGEPVVMEKSPEDEMLVSKDIMETRRPIFSCACSFPSGSSFVDVTGMGLLGNGNVGEAAPECVNVSDVKLLFKLPAMCS